MKNIPESVNYRTYHDEEGRLHYETMIFFSQCNPDQKISLNEVLKLTSDLAVEDFNRQIMSREILAEKGLAILVSRESFRFHRYPCENEHIKIHTWEEKCEPLQFVRAFEIESADGTKLMTAKTAWLLVDVKSRRILPIKKFSEIMPDYVPSVKNTELDCLNYGKIMLPEDAELWDERVIRYSDLDANGHTNNSRYGAFTADALPEEFAKTKFKDFRINFAKEAMLGQTLKIFGKVLREENTIIVAGKTEEGTSFEVELKW